MDIRLINNAVAAVLVSGAAFFGTGLIGDLLVRVKPLKEPAISISTEPPAAAAAPEPELPLAQRLAQANAAAGGAFGKILCGICHTFDEGGKAGVGPNLYNIVGSRHGAMDGFAYSQGLKDLPGTWTYEQLDKWLERPSALVPGTKMAFGGIPKGQQRADVIAWLRSLSAEPKPLP